MKLRAVFLVCVAVLFALTPLILPSFDGYDPEDFPVAIARPSVQPAGWAFSIWLPIYAGLLAHAAFGLVQRHSDPRWDRPRGPLMAALLCGTLWVALAEDRPVLATLVILAMLGFALAALAAVARARAAPRLLALSPVALFAGWVSAAAGAASGVTLAGLGWLTDTAATLVSLAAVLALAAGVQGWLGRVPEYGAPVIWALLAIAVANRGLNDPVALAAAAAALVMAGLVAGVMAGIIGRAARG